MAVMMFRSACMVLLAVSCVDAAPAQTLARPTWTHGDTWRYRISLLPAHNRGGTFTYEGTVAVKDRQPDRYNVNFSGYYGNVATGADRTVRYSLDLNRTALAYHGGPLNDTTWYRWPLQIGAKWEFPYHQPDGQSISIWEVEVRGWEKVTVPAGTFDTVHLTGIRKTLTGSKGTANEDMWYAPDVKRHIKHERYTASGPYIYEHWVEELTSFELR